MLLALKKAVFGSKVHGTDGSVGSIRDVYFNGALWNVRYMVVDTGTWLSGTKVLLSPSAVQQCDWQAGTVNVDLTTDQVKDCPGVLADAPVSRQLEEKLANHYNWPVYWGMGISGAPVAERELAVAAGAIAVEAEEKLLGEEWPVLRSALEVKGYRIEGTDGEIGYVEDFIMEQDKGQWILRYMVANTGSWWPGKSVLVAPQWVEKIRWSERKVHVDLQQESLKEAPAFDPSVPINRQYEGHLYDFHGRERYWK
jgi:hypothetical protein